MIYDQKGSTCTGFALAGAMGNTLGIKIPEEEVYAYYKKYDDDRPGIRITSMVKNLLTKETFSGHHIKDFEIIYNAKDGTRNYKNGISQRTKYEFTKGWAVLVGFKLGKHPQIELDYNNIYRSPVRQIGAHLMFVKSIWFDKYGEHLGFVIQNSWGEDFGDKGTFRITKDDFYKDIQMVVSIKL